MFQNVYRDYTEEKDEINIKSGNRVIDFIKMVVKGQSIVLYILSLMLSCVDGIGVNYSIFSVAILAATISNSIPVGILFILTLLGNFIKFQTAGLLSYLFTASILVLFILMFKPKKLLLEYESEKIKLGKYVFWAVFLGQALKMLFNQILVYDLLASFVFAILTYIFYKIFVNSIIVIQMK